MSELRFEPFKIMGCPAGKSGWYPDIREGENSTSQLYIYIRQKKAEAAGIPFDPAKVMVPFNIDLRMS